jgi:chromosome segregation protein
MAEASGGLAAADRRSEEIGREIAVVTSEAAGIEKDMAGADAERAAVQARLEESRVAGARLDERIAGLKRERAEAVERRDRVRTHVTRVKVTLASALEKQTSLERQLDEAKEALEERAKALEAAWSDIEAAREASAQERKTLESAGARTEAATREANAARVVLAVRQRQARSLKEEAAKLSPAIREMRSELDAARAAISELSIEEREATVRLNEVVTRAREEMGASTEDLAAPAQSAEDPAAVDAEIEDISRKLGSMGAVNFEALAELDDLQARQAFLSGQRNDLVGAQEQLEGIITKTRATSRRMFIESFEAIRENFANTFRRLFGGGRADCVLADPEDVLESPVQILAKPPGKELSNLNLLSGGEKAMTAVALLFAMFATRPSPFLILDEVDAPLDESNIGRFIEVMKDFLPTSQFVVITHNRRTMAAADTLYGITMEERGVSKKVSVSFREEPEALVVGAA